MISKFLFGAGAASLLCAAPAQAAIEWTVASGGNGHFYEYVSLIPTLTFTGAVAHAATASPAMAGFTAHMATITSAAESAFIYNSFNGPNWGAQGWIAGSDASVEGEWRWIAGPEAGTLFWTGGQGGSSPNYANWNNASLPDNNPGNNALYTFQMGSTGWAVTSGTAQGSNYILEYSPDAEFRDVGGVPEPSAWALMLVGFFGLGAALRRRPTSHRRAVA